MYKDSIPKSNITTVCFDLSDFGLQFCSICPAQFQTPARCCASRLPHTAERPHPIPTSSPLPPIVTPGVQRNPALPEDFPSRGNTETPEPFADEVHQAAVDPEALSDRDARVKERTKPDSRIHKHLNGM